METTFIFYMLDNHMVIETGHMQVCHMYQVSNWDPLRKLLEKLLPTNCTGKEQLKTIDASLWRIETSISQAIRGPLISLLLKLIPSFNHMCTYLSTG